MFLQTLKRSFSAAPGIKTALYDAHVAAGGKMVTYAGYELPVQYKDTLTQSHLHCRSNASLFDVSHMGQLRIRGQNRVKFIESLVPSDIANLKPGQARLSVLLNERGGIIDDCMITNKADHLFMVVNAGCKHKDMEHLKKHIDAFNQSTGSDISMEYLDEKQRSLVALQGPKAHEVLQRVLDPSSGLDVSKFPFMFSADAKIKGIDVWITRCGYTGEDGFEISVASDKALDLWSIFAANQEVRPAGLGVRDSLRLEAGLCLYGHDLNEDITPIEASLAWLIPKRRREEGGFPGAAEILRQIKEGPKQKRVGMFVLKGAPAREGVEILDESGNTKIGTVTSGTLSPVLNRNISMAYVQTPFSKDGTKVKVNVRGKINDAEITKMPFVPSRYFKL